VTPLTVAYVGNFDAPWFTECHVADALEVNGHTVVRLDETDRATWVGLARPPAEWAMVLWTASRPANGALVGRALDAAKAANLPVVGYHLDRWWGLRREADIATSQFHRGVDVLCTADGGHQAEWSSVGIEHWWMPPAIAGAEAARTPNPRDGEHIVFVGSWDRYTVAREWPLRMQLVEHLRARWGELVEFYPRSRLAPVRGQALTDLYAAATVAVGDSCLAGDATHYWSDRIPETLGRGGYLIHPDVIGLDEHYTPGVHLDTYPVGDFDALDTLIEAALADPERGRAIGTAAKAHVIDRHLYEHRLADVMERLWQTRTLRTYQRHAGVTTTTHRQSRVTARFDLRPGTTDGEVVDELWRDDQYRLTRDQVADGAVIDVGANIGAFAIWAAAAGAHTVHAYEPEPSIADRLDVNISINSDARRVVKVHRCAVWSAGETLRVERAVAGYEGGTRTRPSCEYSGDGYDVPTVTLRQALDAAAGPGGRLALLKIDCEGCEYPLLAGAFPSDLDRIDRIVMEFHGRQMRHMVDMPGSWRMGTVVEQLAEVGIPTIFGRPSTGGLIYWRHHHLDAHLAGRRG